MKKILLIFSLFTVLSVFSEGLFAAGVDRYAIYVGSNNGGKDRQRLLYAGTDAQNIKKVMLDVGGISDSNSYLLIDPNKKEIDAAIKDISSKIQMNKKNSVRSEFIFYYSGHSDEEAILLGDNRYDYSSLKENISDIPSDIHVVILDSCYSGNFIRTKGGQKKKPFLLDDSSVVKGHAYLSSSSETESSQESDEIGASYFTNAVITGLRGAADTSGDKKVTLNELYSYAFNDTLQKTEETKAGPQHPNYNITLVGSGDLILSDFSESDSVVSIAKNVSGKIIIRDENGKLVSEINKSDEMPILLALPQGKYSVVVIGDSTLEGVFELKKDEAFVLEENRLVKVEGVENRTRGDKQEEDETFVFDRNAVLDKIKPLTTNLPFDFLVCMNMPFDCVFEGAAGFYALRDDMEVPGFIPLVFEFKNSVKTFYGKKDVVTIATGLNVEWDILKSSGKFGGQVFISPCIGVLAPVDGGLPLEGAGVYIYPLSIFLYSSYGTPYFKYKSSIQSVANIVNRNVLIGLESGVDFYWKDWKFTPDISFGVNLGFMAPSKKNWNYVKEEKLDKIEVSKKKKHDRAVAKEKGDVR